MEKVLTSICAILPQNSIDHISKICKEANSELKHSERFFLFPLHVSLKRTFYTDKYDILMDDLKELVHSTGIINCGSYYLYPQKDMLWLRFTYEDELKAIHERIDEYLNYKYHIPIDEFDRRYVPHVTLFSKCEKKELDFLYKKINDKLISEEIKLDHFAIGNKEKGFVYINAV